MLRFLCLLFLLYVALRCVIFVIYMAYHSKRIVKLSTDDLTAIFEAQKRPILYFYAARELKKRNHDIDFTLPYFVDLCLSRTRFMRHVGWNCLRRFFHHINIGCNFRRSAPSCDDIWRIRTLSRFLEEHKDVSSKDLPTFSP